MQDPRIQDLSVRLLYDLLADCQLLPRGLNRSTVAIWLLACADDPLSVRVNVAQYVAAKQWFAESHCSRITVDVKRLVRFFIKQTHDQYDIMIHLPVIERLLLIVWIILGLDRVFELLVLLLLFVVELLLGLFFRDLFNDRDF